MSVLEDVTPVIDEIYPLYLQVYERSNLRFEKLTEEYFCELGRRMRDRVRFFVWRQNGRIVAFASCMTHDDSIYAEYIGLDYELALELHLYHYIFRDVVSWAIAHGYKWFRSSGLNYDPKLHLRQELDPVDLYVRHISPVANTIIRWVLPWLEPTRYEKTLPKFSNYHELWATR
jgi:predicted N-acyltransferase